MLMPVLDHLFTRTAFLPCRGAFQRDRDFQTEGFANRTEKRRGIPADFRKTPRLERLETVRYFRISILRVAENSPAVSV